MLLSSHHYLFSSELGQTQFLQTFLDEELAKLYTEAQQRAAKHSKSPQISTLSISMVWELVRTPVNDSSSTGCRRRYEIDLTYESASWTKLALTTIAEQSATEL